MQLMKVCVEKNEPILISGMPGVGKTSLGYKVGKVLGRDVIVSHPVIEDPTNYKGMPWVVTINGEVQAKWIPFGDLVQLINAKNNVIWLIDDIGQAPLSVQAALMQLVHRDSRAINGNKISDSVSIIACTNRRKDKAGVTGFIEPLKSRFLTMVELEPDVKDWQEWALTDGNIDLSVVSYLRYRPELFCKPDENNDLRAWPSPRTWEHASRLISQRLPRRILTECLNGTIGEAAAVDFAKYLRVWDELPDIDEIIASPKTTALPTTSMSKYACVGALVGAMDKKNASPILEYIDRLDPEFGTLFAVFLKTRAPQLMETKAYIDWTCKHQKEWGLGDSN